MMMDLRKLQRDPAAFRAAIVIDAGGSICPFGEVAERWQLQDFESMDPAWRRMGHGSDTPEPTHTRAWIERPRGHSKSTDEAIMVLWALFAARRPIKGIAAAADRDQARILRDAIDLLVRLNPWLGEVIEVQRDCVVNKHTGARLEIIASDVASSYGLLADFIVCDEVTHWQKPDMWSSLVSTAAKKANCVLVVITNAGIDDSWQANARLSVSNPEVAERWYFRALDGPTASWITEATLNEQRLLLPAPAFERLWLNKWTGGGGDALTRKAIDDAFDPGLAPMTGKECGWAFIAGLDLGVKQDSSAVVVVAVEPGTGGEIRLAHTHTWRPDDSITGKVDLIEVERYLLDLDRRFNLQAIAFDPWQAELLAQRLEIAADRYRESPFFEEGEKWLREMPATGANLRDQASLTISCFNARRLMLYPHDDLRRDLLKLRVEEKSYGYRLVSPRDATGHGDLFSAFALALPLAHQLSGVAEYIDEEDDGLMFDLEI